jgi:hypothetical protein
MPAKDTFHAKRPEVNEWMSGRAGLSAPSGRAGSKATTTSSRASSPKRDMSAQLQRLAQRTQQNPDELAERIPADTLRRTKYPVLETVDAEGRRTFKHDIGITDNKRRSL